MIEDFERCYRAVESRDERFDGVIYIAVETTGIYCRPSCPARPKRKNIRFFATAAAAQAAGFRACRRCRPEIAPGSPEWDTRADVVGRAMRLIADGLVDREGVSGLARRLGYSERQVHRQLLAEVGVGALTLARAHRAQTARMLIDGTQLSMADIAFAAGFSSVRQFNDVVRRVFASTPTELRARRKEIPMNGGISLRLPFRRPYSVESVIGFLGPRCVPGVEELVGNVYRRTVRLPHGYGIAELHPAEDHFMCHARLQDLRDVGALVERCRSLLDLDCDPIAIEDVLRRDSSLRRTVKSRRGTRVVGTLDPHELALRAVLGQQVSVKAAVTGSARMVDLFGSPIDDPEGGLTHLFPSAEDIAGADLSSLKMPAGRRVALSNIADVLATEKLILDPGADRAEVHQSLLAIPGIGPWTASYIGMRALNDPDAFLPGDLGARRGATALELPEDARSLEAHSERWRPWRAYALQHLWAAACEG